MKKLAFMNTISRSAHRMAFKLQKHSPEILVVAGVIGAVASAVMACKATTKLGDILDESRDKIDSIHDVIENPDKVNEEYTQEDGNKDLAIVYTQTALKVAKVYAPAVILGGLSITAILTSNNILRKRNIALAAAYTAVDKSFKEYRGRVVERFGKELDKELRYNIKAKEVEETVTDEKGNEKTVKKTVDVVDPNTISEFAKFFDDGCIGWTKDPELNMIFLRQQEAAATKRLEDRGHLFLNEVYDMINKILIFAAGVAIGSAVTWKLVKDKYKKLADEEIASVKEVWSKKHPASEGIAETDVKESVKTDTTQQPKKNPDFKDYRAMQEIIDKNSYKEEDYMYKYVISPEEFGESELPSESLTYWADGVVTDEANCVMDEDDIDETIGSDALNHFGEYEDDSVFVRNETLGKEYEILMDTRKFSDVYPTR